MQEDTNTENVDGSLLETTTSSTGTNREDITREMLESGVQYGRAKRFTNPKLKEFFIKSNKTVEIFDFTKISEKLDNLVDYMKQLLDDNKTILFVGVQPAASEQIGKIAKFFNQPHMINKWVGGLLTNFSTIRTRIRFFDELIEKRENGEIDTYTPLEKSRALKELQKMENIYGGVIEMKKLPDAIFTINIEYKPHRTMQREAKVIRIPVIGICGADNDPDKFKIFVPANDKAPSSIKWLLEYITSQLSENKNTELNEITESEIEQEKNEDETKISI